MVSPDIISACQQRDQRAFKSLYDACLPYVFTVVKSYTDNFDFRKDLVQEVFAKVFLNIDKYEPDKGDFKFWLRKITANQCLMFFRDKQKHFIYEDFDNAAFVNKTSEYIDLGKLDLPVWKKLIDKMPDGYRKVFSLAIFEGYTHEDISKELGCSVETSRSQLSRSKQWLRQNFSENKKFITDGFF